MIKKYFTLCLLFISCGMANGQSNSSSINEVFKKFQNGYSKRDTSDVIRFTNDLCTKDIQIIGTGADEWVQGIEAAKTLFKNDWLYWFNVNIDTSSINFSGHDNVIFFRLKATASISFPSKEAAYEFAYRRLQQIVSNEKNPKDKMLSYSSESSNLVEQIEKGSLEIKYMLRISGALIKEKDKWLFKQLVFSFPYPMVRE